MEVEVEVEVGVGTGAQLLGLLTDFHTTKVM